MTTTPTTASSTNPHVPVKLEWLGQTQEAVIDPDTPLIDAHHHLWDRAYYRYLFPELLEDLDSGHNVCKTVFVECDAMYRGNGPKHLSPVGETEFVNGVAAMFSSNAYGPRQACAAIVGYADLRLGAQVREVLEAHLGASGGRFRGIRNVSAWHEDSAIKGTAYNPPPGLLLDPDFRKGFACLAPMGLSFDAWFYFTQLGDILDLAESFPDTRIVIDHIGGILGVGPYEGRREYVFDEWRRSMTQFANLPNVAVKLSGLAMRTAGFHFHEQAKPPNSEQLAQAWRPYFETCIEMFGPNRCMFASNFPVDKGGCSYRTLWNAFKRIAQSYSVDERAALC